MILSNPQFFVWVASYVLISLYRKFNNLEVDPITGKNYDLTWEEVVKILLKSIRDYPLIFIILTLIDLYRDFSTGGI
jgi:hypothetical protein